MINVAIFARVSSDQQDYQRQIADLQQLATNFNWQVVATITEIGSASKKENAARPKLDELLQLARSGRIQKILVTESSRLGRRPKETRNLIEELMEIGVSVYALNLGLETLLPNGRRNPMAAIAQKVLEEVDWMETERMSDRISSGKRNSKKTQGRPEGTSKTPAQYIKEYPAAAKMLRSRCTIREVMEATGNSSATVQAVKKALGLHEQNVASQKAM